MSYKNLKEIIEIMEKMEKNSKNITQANYMINQFCYNLPSVIKTGFPSDKEQLPELLKILTDNYNKLLK